MGTFNIKRPWVYIGGGDAQGSLHLIIEHSEGNVVTWSVLSAENPMVGGWSWRGPEGDFIQQFKAA